MRLNKSKSVTVQIRQKLENGKYDTKVITVYDTTVRKLEEFIRKAINKGE